MGHVHVELLDLIVGRSDARRVVCKAPRVLAAIREGRKGRLKTTPHLNCC